MASELPPPPPPRPDLASPASSVAAPWRGVDPGRMGATKIVGSGLRLWAESWFRWFLVSLTMTGSIAVLTAALDPWSATFGWWYPDRPFAHSDPNALVVLLGIVGALFLGPWEFVILTRAALHSSFAEPLRGSSLIGGTIRGVHSLLWIGIVLALLAIPFFFLFVVIVGITVAERSEEEAAAVLVLSAALFGFLIFYLAPRLATLASVFVGQDSRGTKAIRGAWRLSRRAWATSAGALVLSVLIAIAISIPAGVLISELFPSVSRVDAIARAAIQSVLNGILTPMTTAIVAALYLELMARKGVLDQEVLRTSLARFDR